MSEDIFFIRYQAKEKGTSCLFFVTLDIGISIRRYSVDFKIPASF